MNLILTIISLLFAVSVLAQESISFSQVCQNETCHNYKNGLDLGKANFQLKRQLPAKYISDSFMLPSCTNKNECYLFLGSVADTYSISVNNQIITNLTLDSTNYSTQNSVVLPIPAVLLYPTNNIITIEVKDLNKYQWGLLNKNIKLTNYSEARLLSIKDWLARTGFTIFSAYFLLIFSVLALFTFFIIQNKNTLAISLYCLASFVYLISFSEFPRELMNPEIFSGIVHFPLRLLQDVALFWVFHEVLNRDKKFAIFYKSIFVLYGLAIGTYVIYILLGKFDFISAKQVILIAAPLVAMPMCYGFLLSTILQKGIERSILVPLFFVLFLFQVNDLFLFWQLVQSAFTVKFYIPFIVILVAFIEIRRYSMDYTSKTLLANKVQNAKQIAHDIRSPLSALNILSERVSFKSEEKEIFIGVLQAIDGIASSLIQQTALIQHKKSNISDVISKVIAQKKVEYPELVFDYVNRIPVSELCAGDPIELSRVISNIINNAWESMSEKPIIKIELEHTRNFVQIKISDTGIGMPKHVIKKLGTFGFTYGKETHAATAGSGLGVYNAIKTIEQLGGEFAVVSVVNIGTTIEIKIPRG